MYKKKKNVGKKKKDQRALFVFPAIHIRLESTISIANDSAKISLRLLCRLKLLGVTCSRVHRKGILEKEIKTKLSLIIEIPSIKPPLVSI